MMDSPGRRSMLYPRLKFQIEGGPANAGSGSALVFATTESAVFCASRRRGYVFDAPDGLGEPLPDAPVRPLGAPRYIATRPNNGQQGWGREGIYACANGVFRPRL